MVGRTRCAPVWRASDTQLTRAETVRSDTTTPCRSHATRTGGHVIAEPTKDDLVQEVEDVAGHLIDRYGWTERRLLQAARSRRIVPVEVTGFRLSGEDDYREELQETIRAAGSARRTNAAILRAVASAA